MCDITSDIARNFGLGGLKPFCLTFFSILSLFLPCFLSHLVIAACPFLPAQHYASTDISCRLSITFGYCIKMANRRIMQRTPYDSRETQVFYCQRSC